MDNHLVDDVLDPLKLSGATPVTISSKSLAESTGANRRLWAETRDQECGSLMIVGTVHLN